MKLIKFDKNSIEDLANEMIDESMLFIFEKPTKRKFMFIENILMAKHENKKIQMPPGIANPDILYFLYDSLLIGRERKISLILAIEERWSKNTKHDQIFEKWLKLDFFEKLKFITNKLIREGKNTQELIKCRSSNAVIECIDSIIRDPGERLDFIKSSKVAYSQKCSKLKSEQKMIEKGIKPANINVKIPNGHHSKLESIKEQHDLNQSEAICMIIDYYYNNEYFGKL